MSLHPIISPPANDVTMFAGVCRLRPDLETFDRVTPDWPRGKITPDADVTFREYGMAFANAGNIPDLRRTRKKVRKT